MRCALLAAFFLAAACGEGAPRLERCVCYFDDGVCCPSTTPYRCLRPSDAARPGQALTAADLGPTCVADSIDCWPHSAAKCGSYSED